MKNLLNMLRRRGNHRRDVERKDGRPEENELRLPRRGSGAWSPQDPYEFDKNLVAIDAIMKGRGLQ